MKLTPYEQNQLLEIDAWKNEEPTVASKAFEVLSAPLTWLVQKVVPEAALKGALEAGCKAGATTANETVVARAAQVNDILELRSASLDKCDLLANEAHNWSIGIAIAQGGLEGGTGLPGLALGIPATITLGFHTVHQIGLCYGYRCTSDFDTHFVYGVLAASGANSVAEKTASLATLQSLYVIIATETWKEIAEIATAQVLGREAAIIAVKSLAKQLGINLTKRKALQAIPAVGIGVGAAVNASYIKDVGWAARRSFQLRWLIDNGKLLKQDVASAKQPPRDGQKLPNGSHPAE